MEKLLKEHLDTIFSYSLFITGNREKALDLMQETMVTVLTKKHLYAEESHFRSWIFRVLKNNYLNQIKKNAVRNEVYLNDISRENEETPLFSSGFESRNLMEEMSDPILRDRIGAVFEEMPFEYKDVVILIEIEGSSYEEAARQLEIPVGTVMSRLHRARNYLKKSFRKEACELKIVSDRVRKNG